MGGCAAKKLLLLAISGSAIIGEESRIDAAKGSTLYDLTQWDLLML